MVLFGLVILVLGGATATIVGFSDLAPPDKRLVVFGAGLLLLVVLVMVFLLAWFKAENLVYSETGHLAQSAMGRPDNPIARDVLSSIRGEFRMQEQPPEEHGGDLDT